MLENLSRSGSICKERADVSSPDDPLSKLKGIESGRYLYCRVRELKKVIATKTRGKAANGIP